MLRNKKEDLKNPCILKDISKITNCFLNCQVIPNERVYEIWTRYSDSQDLYWVPTAMLSDSEIIEAYKQNV